MSGQDSLYSNERALSDEYCTVCKNFLPPDAVYCEYCGPPPEPPDFKDPSLSLPKTVVSIFVIVLLFGAVLISKQEGSVQESIQALVPNLSGPSKKKEQEGLAKDKDFQVIHFVEVDYANVRDKATTTNSKVLAVLQKGESLDIIEKGQFWTKIKLNGKTAWIASHLIGSRVE